MMGGEMFRQIQASTFGVLEKTPPPSAVFLKSPEAWRQRYRLNDSFIGFRGHFEGHPVLPALAQVFFAQHLVQAVVKRQVTLETIIQAKFLSLVRPGRLMSVYVPFSEAYDALEWRVHLTSAAEGRPETDASFLRLKFKEDGHGL